MLRQIIASDLPFRFYSLRASFRVIIMSALRWPSDGSVHRSPVFYSFRCILLSSLTWTRSSLTWVYELHLSIYIDLYLYERLRQIRRSGRLSVDTCARGTTYFRVCSYTYACFQKDFRKHFQPHPLAHGTASVRLFPKVRVCGG